MSDKSSFGGMLPVMCGFAAALLAALPAERAMSEDRPLYFVGVGIEDFKNKHSEAPGALLEYAFAPSYRPDWISGDAVRWRAAFMGSTDKDFWVGAGISYEFPLAGSRWFGEMSFLPGVFYRGNTEMGQDDLHFPQFRSQLAVGYQLSDGATIGVSVSHRSNGKLDSDGSSMETFMLRYSLASF